MIAQRWKEAGDSFVGHFDSTHPAAGPGTAPGRQKHPAVTERAEPRHQNVRCAAKESRSEEYRANSSDIRSVWYGSPYHEELPSQGRG